MLVAKVCIGIMYPTQAMPLMIFKRQAVVSNSILYACEQFMLCLPMSSRCGPMTSQSLSTVHYILILKDMVGACWTVLITLQIQEDTW